MRRLTIGHVATALKIGFPYMTADILRPDAETGELPTYPRFHDDGWRYVEHGPRLRDYIVKKARHKIEDSVLFQILERLGLNAFQSELKLN